MLFNKLDDHAVCFYYIFLDGFQFTTSEIGLSILLVSITTIIIQLVTFGKVTSKIKITFSTSIFYLDFLLLLSISVLMYWLNTFCGSVTY